MGNGAGDRLTERKKGAEALTKGFVAEECCECVNFTLKAMETPNILECDTCGNKQQSTAARDEPQLLSRSMH